MKPNEPEFDKAAEFLSRCKRRKTVWKGATSYGWKHQAENYFEARDGRGGYISNETFIDAALALGFIVERIQGSPNCWMNISASESYAWRGDGRFLNHYSGRWMTFKETFGKAKLKRLAASNLKL